MTTRRTSVVILLVILSLSTGSAAMGMDPVLGFARQLQAEGEYYRAITEYKRVLHFAPAESLATRGAAILGIGGALMSAGEHARSAEWLQAHTPELRTEPVRSEAVRLMYRALLADGDGNRLLVISRELGTPSAETRLYEGLAYARIGHWTDAATVFRDLADDDGYGPIASSFLEVARKGERVAWKSPGVAAALGIIPGAGYWYAGHRQTAIASLLVNGVFVGATIQAFRSDQAILGGFLSFFTVSWYAGNIYGSAPAARRYNEDLQESLWRQFEF